jgi:hypothetical protein
VKIDCPTAEQPIFDAFGLEAPMDPVESVELLAR